MTKRYFISLVIILSFFSFFSTVPFSNAVGGEASLYEDARKSYFSLKKSEKKRNLRHHWLNVIKKYNKVFAKYPKGKYADKSLFMAAQLHHELHPFSGKKEDLTSSNRYCEKLFKNYPKSNLTDDALFIMGKNYEKLKKKKKAYNTFVTIVEKYKNGDQVRLARKKVVELKKFATKSTSSVTAKVKKHSHGTTSTKEPKNVTKSNKSQKGVAHVTKIRHWSNPHYTRIVVGLDGPAKYKGHLLRPDPSIGKPPRFYVDIFNSKRIASLKEEIPINDGLLKRARAAQYDGSTVRVVLDIENIKTYKIFPMMDPFRIVIDMWGGAEIKRPTIEALLQGKEGDKKSLQGALEEESESLSLSQQLGLGIRKIVIDAGHGGKDPGAVGYGGAKEKDVNLILAKSLKVKLEKQFNYQVVLTRSTDRFLSLEERTAIANMESADLFISIHANANRNKKAHGIETYVMNARASDRFAAEVAARENAITSNSQGEFGSILESILVDMTKTNKLNESSKLASSIQTNISGYMSKRYSRVKDLGVKKAPFYVLIGANMPSVLIETGFITNKREGKRLSSRKYLDSMANAIALGINNYAKVIKTASNI